MSTSCPHPLSGLSTREQIADTLTRACLALDSNDKSLWASAWSTEPDIAFDLNGRLLKGQEGVDSGFLLAGPLDTQHLISGVRIDVQEGANTAHMTANGLNQHYKPGQGLVDNAEHLLAGNMYDVQVVKQSDGQWKIRSWKIKTIWKQGNWSVIRDP